MNRTEQLSFLKSRFGSQSTMNEANYDALCKILDSANDEAIVYFAKANIKFVSKLAVNRCVRRGLEVQA